MVHVHGAWCLCLVVCCLGVSVSVSVSGEFGVWSLGFVFVSVRVGSFFMHRLYIYTTLPRASN
jgi:hypothetical protein